jgi:hypothetical protein
MAENYRDAKRSLRENLFASYSALDDPNTDAASKTEVNAVFEVLSELDVVS